MHEWSYLSLIYSLQTLCKLMDGRFADSEIFNLGSGIGDGAAVRVLAPLTRWPPSTASTPLVVSAAEILTLSRLAAIKFWAESSRLNPSCTLHRGSRVMTDWFYSLQAVYTTFMYGMTAVGHAWACCRSNICTLGQAGCTWMNGRLILHCGLAMPVQPTLCSSVTKPQVTFW